MFNLKYDFDLDPTHFQLICNVLKKNGTSPVSVVISASTKRLNKVKSTEGIIILSNLN